MCIREEGLLLLLLAWLSMVSSTPIPHNVENPTANLTFGPVPPLMQVVPEGFIPIPFGMDGVFFNMMEALRVLAEGDFDGVTVLKTFTTDQYPQPTITLTSHSGYIQCGYAIWGLLLAWSWLGQPGHSIITHFQLLWNGQVVGGIQVGDLMPHDAATQQLGQPIKSTSSATQMRFNNNHTDVALIKSSNLTSILPDTHFKITYDYFGDEIDDIEMKLAFMYTLAQAARYPSDDWIDRTWRPNIQALGCRVVAQNLNSGPPPEFNFYWLIESVAAAGKILITRNIYRGLRVISFVDDIQFGSLNFYDGHWHFPARPALDSS